MYENLIDSNDRTLFRFPSLDWISHSESPPSFSMIVMQKLYVIRQVDTCCIKCMLTTSKYRQIKLPSPQCTHARTHTSPLNATSHKHNTASATPPPTATPSNNPRVLTTQHPTPPALPQAFAAHELSPQHAAVIFPHPTISRKNAPISRGSVSQRAKDQDQDQGQGQDWEFTHSLAMDKAVRQGVKCTG